MYEAWGSKGIGDKSIGVGEVGRVRQRGYAQPRHDVFREGEQGVEGQDAVVELGVDDRLRNGKLLTDKVRDEEAGEIRPFVDLGVPGQVGREGEVHVARLGGREHVQGREDGDGDLRDVEGARDDELLQGREGEGGDVGRQEGLLGRLVVEHESVETVLLALLADDGRDGAHGAVVAVLRERLLGVLERAQDYRGQGLGQADGFFKRGHWKVVCARLRDQRHIEVL